MENIEHLDIDKIDYYFLENKIKELLSLQLEKQFFKMYEKLSPSEKKFFRESNFYKNENDNENVLNSPSASNYSKLNFECKVNWVFNINSVHTNRGDISTSTMQKFFHQIFKDMSDFDSSEEESLNTQNSNNTINPENDLKGDFIKFKNTFIELFNISLILSLNGDNLKTNGLDLNEYIGKFEIKNGFLNLFLKGKGKDLIEVFKNKNKNKNSAEKNNQREIQLDSENQFMFNSIGHIESCFPEKFSVPRQGNLLELTRAKIVINKNVDMSSFDGIENFDFIWIIYVFHLNVHFGKAKISPPKYEGKKLGVFATRSPHRFNPIGLTLAKIEKIEKNEILISSVDMISGTPVIDIKPYHHLESVNLENIKYPEWIKQSASEEKKATVIFTENAQNNLKNILENHKLNFYDKFEELEALIKGVLEIDPHSKYTQKKKDTMLYAFYIDKLNVIYEYNAKEKEVVIHNVEYSEEYKKLRNKDWLENYNKTVEFE